MIRSSVKSACPSCGEVGRRETYDIGSGPELCCMTCDWCWGANGQELKPVLVKCEGHDIPLTNCAICTPGLVALILDRLS